MLNIRSLILSRNISTQYYKLCYFLKLFLSSHKRILIKIKYVILCLEIMVYAGVKCNVQNRPVWCIPRECVTVLEEEGEQD